MERRQILAKPRRGRISLSQTWAPDTDKPGDTGRCFNGYYPGKILRVKYYLGHFVQVLVISSIKTLELLAYFRYKIIRFQRLLIENYYC